jgi:hypothetical protein
MSQRFWSRAAAALRRLFRKLVAWPLPAGLLERWQGRRPSRARVPRRKVRLQVEEYEDLCPPNDLLGCLLTPAFLADGAPLADTALVGSTGTSAATKVLASAADAGTDSSADGSTLALQR